MNELVLQATPCGAAAAAGESAAIAGVAAVLLGCAWIGRARVRR